MRPLDIAIAGCGPGGLAAALLLHRLGHKVTLFERFESPRPLGSGLIIQPIGLEVLESLGLAAGAHSEGARIDRLFGRAVPSGRVALDVRYAALAGEHFGVGIHRGTLFALLHSAALAENLPMETGRLVSGSRATAGGRSLVFETGAEAGPFDLVVDSLGSRSPLVPVVRNSLRYGALWTTLDWVGSFDRSALEQRYRGAAKMVGVLPVGRLPGSEAQKAAFFWSLRHEDYPEWERRGLPAWKEEVLGIWPETEPLLDQVTDPRQMTFARYCHHTFGRPAERALVHIGDAWHSTSPQLGQGANMALLDAAALSNALAASADVAEALRAYVRARRNHVRLYQAMSSLFTPFYQSDSWLLPKLRDHVAGPLSRIRPLPAILAALVSGSIGNPLKRNAAILGGEHVLPSATETLTSPPS